MGATTRKTTANQAPQAPQAQIFGASKQGWDKAALSAPLVNEALLPTGISLINGEDFKGFDDDGLMISFQTNPSPESGKKPWPFISFKTDDGRILRVYGQTAAAIMDNVPFLDGDIEGEIVSESAISITDKGIVEVIE